MRVCPACHGSGEVHQYGPAINPFSGIRTLDPQMQESEMCRRCDGEGVLGLSRPDSAPPVSTERPRSSNNQASEEAA